MFYLEIEGSPYERGKTHGESLKEHIDTLVKGLKTWTRELGYTSFDLLVEDILDHTGFLSTAKKWTPDLVEEIKGIADGAKISFNIIFIIQFLNEFQWYIKQRVRKDYWKKLQDESMKTMSQQCSALGVFDQTQNYPIIAQTADNSPDWIGLETLIHAKDPEISMEWYHITFPGLIGFYGMNNHSVGVCVNAMNHILKKNINGLGAPFISRIILNQKSLTDVVKIIQKLPYASGENYLIGDRNGVADYECSPNQVKQFLPYQGSTRVYHTNHPLVNTDFDYGYLNLLKEIYFPGKIYEMYFSGEFEDGKANLDSETRFKSLKNNLQENSRPITVEKIKKILGAHDVKDYPVCCHDIPSGAQTNMGIIMELSKSPKLHISFGVPCKTEFSTYEF
jgi:predicted choloylglycine hydrolase